MPPHSLDIFGGSGEKRFLVGLVGQGPALDIFARILERPDFALAFPRVKIVGWCPYPEGRTEDQPQAPSLPKSMQHVASFPDATALFAARPGIQLALDLTPTNLHIAAIRKAAPIHTTVVTSDTLNLFALSAITGKFAPGGDEQLLKAHDLLTLLMDQLDDDVFIIREDGIIVDLNRHAAERLGVSKERAIGSHCNEIDTTTPCCDEESKCPFAIALTTGKKADRLFTRLDPSGFVRYLHTFCFPILGVGGTPSQVLLLQRDATEGRHFAQRMRQTEKMAVIGELSTYMAHEIRNPLFPIGGFASALLRNPSLDEDAREKVRIIFEESRKLDDILRNILNFARPTKQQIGTFDIEGVTRQTMELMLIGSAERGIIANVTIATDLPKVRGNAENLKQCLLNLLKNATEAMPEGGNITLTAKRVNATVHICVTDTGLGIPPELHDQVFSPFFTTKDASAGLGLAMTRKIMEEAGGTVLLSSRLGKGTTVTLVLPAALAVGEPEK